RSRAQLLGARPRGGADLERAQGPSARGDQVREVRGGGEPARPDQEVRDGCPREGHRRRAGRRCRASRRTIVSQEAKPGRDSSPLPNDQQLGEWLRGTGPQADLAICTRVRFARNLQTHRFSPTISTDESTDLVAFVTRQITKPGFYEQVRVVDVRTL